MSYRVRVQESVMSELGALEYPFDWKVLNRKKKSIKKQLETGEGFLEKKLQFWVVVQLTK